MKHITDKIIDVKSKLNDIGYDSRKEVKILPKVELQIYPPLSYEMTSKRVGALILDIQIKQGDTLGDLLVRLDNENHKAWKRLFDIQTKKMHNPIKTILNGKALSRSVLADTPLSDGDQIKFVLVFTGG